MASLQDQLLKAGLANEKQSKQATKAKKKQTRDAQQQDRAVVAQVKQMLKRCRLDLSGGEITYNFVDGKVIKKLYVEAMQQAALSRGSLVIIGLDEQYFVVPANVATRIEERAPDTFIIRAEAAKDAVAVKDDPYADFVIPDDLMW